MSAWRRGYVAGEGHVWTRDGLPGWVMRDGDGWLAMRDPWGAKRKWFADLRKAKSWAAR